MTRRSHSPTKSSTRTPTNSSATIEAAALAAASGVDSSAASSRRRRRLMPALSVTAALACLVGASLATTANDVGDSWNWPWAYFFMEEPPLSDGELGVALTTVGLDAATLAAVGVDATAVPSLVDAARVHLTSNIVKLRAANESVGKAQGEVDRLTSLIQAGAATPEEIAALEPAKLAATQARAERDALHTALSDAATAAVPGLDGKKNLIGSMQTNRQAGWDLPTEYLAGVHEEPDWVNLRDALSHVRIQEKLNQPPDSGATAKILEAKADPNVAAASAFLATNLKPVAEAWDKAVYKK